MKPIDPFTEPTLVGPAPARDASWALRGDARRRIAGMACAVASVILFASFTVVSRFGLSEGFAVADLAILRFGIAALVLLPFFLRNGLAGLGIVRALALAACGGLGFALLAYAGFALAPAGHAAVMLHGALPLFGALVGALVLGEPVSGRRLRGVVLIAIGIVCIAAGRPWNLAEGRTIVGDLCLLAASVTWAIYGALLTRWNLAATKAAPLVTALSFSVIGIYVVASGHVIDVAPSAGFALQALMQGLLIGVISLFVYSKAVELLGATTVALAATAVPLITVVAAIPLLGEVPAALEWVGLTVAVFGMGVATFRGGRPSWSAVARTR